MKYSAVNDRDEKNIKNIYLIYIKQKKNCREENEFLWMFWENEKRIFRDKNLSKIRRVRVCKSVHYRSIGSIIISLLKSLLYTSYAEIKRNGRCRFFIIRRVSLLSNGITTRDAKLPCLRAIPFLDVITLYYFALSARALLIDRSARSCAEPREKGIS